MRIALVSPYSWSYPGGVTRHIEALAKQFLAGGHDVCVLAPHDPDDRRAARMHRGAHPEPRPLPGHVIALGRTVGLPANGAVSNLALTPHAVAVLRRTLRDGDFDVVHVHEPIAPIVAWDAVGWVRQPLVGTYHCYSTNPLTNGVANLCGARRRMNKQHVRIAVSEAAAWTAQRFFGGSYRVIPNGVDVPQALPPARQNGPLRLLFVGQAVERKGLPVLLRAFECLREHVPATLTIVGASRDEIAPLILDWSGIEALGKVDDARKVCELARADLLVAPSLGGESFGMVLTEAFAAGTPVVASQIPGYAEVVRDGDNGVLIPRGDAAALAAALHRLALDRDRRERMAVTARQAAARYAWPRIADDVLGAYADAIAIGAPAQRATRMAVRIGARSADLQPPRPPRPLPALEARRPERRVGLLRRAALGVAALAGAGLAITALERIGFDRIVASLLVSRPDLVVVALTLMCLSMGLRAVAWHQILDAALPGRRVRRRDAMRGTFIGVLMSATLPARLGEPARSLVVARRLGRARETLPVVLGTVVSQTLLNVVALLVLGAVMFTSLSLFDGHHSALLAAAIAPLALLAGVLVAPTVLRGGAGRAGRAAVLLRQLRGALVRVRAGLQVFRDPRRTAIAAASQLGAWAVQWAACWVLLAALGLDGRAGLGAAAAVLFAVNVTAVLPAAPANLGVFQAACVAVLSGAYHVHAADALAYGIVLQAVELATAVAMGMPALLGEGLSWREVRLRTLHATPVRLPVPEPASKPAA